MKKHIAVVCGGVGVMMLMGCSSDPVSVTPQKEDVFAPQATEQVMQPDALQQDTAMPTVDDQATPTSVNDAAVQSAPVNDQNATTAASGVAAAAQAPQQTTPPVISDAEMEKIAEESKKCVEDGGVYNTFAQKCFHN